MSTITTARIDREADQESFTPPIPSPTPSLADSAMATGTDDEPEMTIADKHSGDLPLDPDGNGTLTPEEAAALLGETSKE